MDNLILNARGSFRWFADPSILMDPSASEYGIYLWTVNLKDGDFIYYVGETGHSFSKRMMDHLKEYLSGFYRIFDPIKFAEGKKIVLWRGMFMEGPKPNIIEFIQHHEQYMPALRSMLDLLNIWVFPTDCAQPVRRRIEGAIAGHLYSQPGLVGQFQDSGIRYVTRKSNEELIRVQIEAPSAIQGLPTALDA